jgi:hypothetical protein
LRSRVLANLGRVKRRIEIREISLWIGLYFAAKTSISARSAITHMIPRESAEARSVALRPSEGVAPYPGSL